MIFLAKIMYIYKNNYFYCFYIIYNTLHLCKPNKIRYFYECTYSKIFIIVNFTYSNKYFYATRFLKIRIYTYVYKQ